MPCDKDQKTSIEEVYGKVRCAIHHSDSTDPGVRVKISGSLFDYKKGVLTSVNRKKFHASVKRALNTYLTEIRDGTDMNLRCNFLKKMDFIAGIRECSAHDGLRWPETAISEMKMQGAKKSYLDKYYPVTPA